MVTYGTDGHVRMPHFRKRDMNEWIKAVAGVHGFRVGSLAYEFGSDERILEVNREYLNHDYYTDIITFDYTEGSVVSGDICISLDTVRSNAESIGTRYEDELCRVIIHGVLHLCGIDDKAPGARAVMERAEDEALSMRPSALIDSMK